MCRRRPNRAGFTYLEMAITVLIMGILAGVAAPSYLSALAEYRVNSAARKIVVDLQYARSEAMRKSVARIVAFDTETNSYTLQGVDDLDHTTGAYRVELVDEPFSSTLISATFGTNAQVEFDMYGRPDATGSVIVESGSLQKTVLLASDGTATIQ